MRQILFLAIITISFPSISRADYIWTWEGSLEGWSARRGDSLLSLVDGPTGDALYLDNQPPYIVTSGVSIENNILIKSSMIVEGFGFRLPMKSPISIDTDRKIIGHGNYFTLEILDGESYSQFIAYPHDGLGQEIALDNGWYRYMMINFSRQPYISNDNIVYFSSTFKDISIDNLNIGIVPEPSSIMGIAMGIFSGSFFLTMQRRLVL